MNRGGRPRDEAARARVCAVLDVHPDMPHEHVARRASTTANIVRDVRRSLGEVAKATPIGERLLRSLEPRHVAALQRLGAAHVRGSDMAVRAILGGAEMQQLLTAAREAT